MVSLVLLTRLLAVPLEWTAPAECPAIEQAQRLVDAELERIPESEREGLSVAGVVLRDAAGFRLEVVLRRPEAAIARVVVLEDCSAAAEALALVVAIAIDPSRVPGVDEPVAKAEPAVPPAATVEPSADPGRPVLAEPPPLPSEEPSRPPGDPVAPRNRVPRVALRGTGGVGVGVLPRVGAQVGGEVAAVWRRARVGVQVEHWVRRRARLDDPATAGGDFSITSARLVGGVIFAWRRLELPLVGFGGLGAVRASGVGVAQPAVRSLLWAEAGAAAGLQWFVRPWLGLGAHAELVVPLVRHTFVLSDTRIVTRTGSAAGVFRAGLELRFP